MVIEGGAELTGAAVDAHGDHRIAMTMGVAGAIASGRTAVSGAEAASVSYPSFWEDLDRVTGGAVAEEGEG